MKIRQKNIKGFTLIEVIVAMFVFVLVIMAISGIFAQSSTSFRMAKSIQKNLEDAQFALNSMAKIFRTSSIASISSTNIRVFDYSQEACLEYRINSNNIQVAAINIPTNDLDGCKNPTGSASFKDLGNAYIKSGNFDVVSSDAGKAGKITIALEVCESSDCKDKVNIQSSVSLRDYAVSMPPLIP